MNTTTDVSVGREGVAGWRLGWLALAFFCGAAVAILTGGCSGVDRYSWRMPWEKEPESIAGLTPPHQRMAELRALAQRGRSTDPAEQQRVSSELAEELAQQDDPLIRVQIVRTLGDYSTEEAAAVLRSAMEDSSADVRRVACEAWAKRGGAEAVELLSQRLSSDTNDNVRLAAARALGETEDPAAVAGLGPALDDQDPALQYRAILSLRKVSGKDFGNDVGRWRQYVQGEMPEPEQPTSIARRLGFPF